MAAIELATIEVSPEAKQLLEGAARQRSAKVALKAAVKIVAANPTPVARQEVLEQAERFYDWLEGKR